MATPGIIIRGETDTVTPDAGADDIDANADGISGSRLSIQDGTHWRPSAPAVRCRVVVRQQHRN
jgi:hypothetical protein